MSAKLLWVVKNLNSDHLSHSGRSEESSIRSHVQTCRAKRGRGGSRRDYQQRKSPHLIRRDIHSAGLPLPLTSFKQSLTEAETRGLEFYVKRTAREWSGWQDEYFWNKLVIQAGYLDTGVTHALISIAAWHRLSALQFPSDHATQLSEFRSAQWRKALLSARQYPNLIQSSIFIQCIILVCLQGHQGDYQDYRLLRSAKAMLQQLDDTSDSTTLELRVSSVEREIINGSIRPLLERLEARRCTMGDLPAALLQSTGLRRLEGLPRRVVVPLPTVFSSLRHARDCLESILYWAHDHTPAADNDKVFERDRSAFQDRLRDQTRSWRAVLRSLAGKVSGPQMGLLELAAIHGIILLSTCGASSETAFDAHVSDFQEMVHILAELEPTETRGDRIRSGSFGIDGGIIDIVSLIGTRCREPHLRRAAERWLLNAFRFEGNRDSLVCAHIIRAWMDLEEMNGHVLCCTDIPESRRYKLIHGARYHDQQLIRLDFASTQFNDVSGIASVTEVWLSEADGHWTLEMPSAALGLADVLIEPCTAAFLDDRKQGRYHTVALTKFFFPIPRL